jgi:hypothetical protein
MKMRYDEWHMMSFVQQRAWLGDQGYISLSSAIMNGIATTQLESQTSVELEAVKPQPIGPMTNPIPPTTNLSEDLVGLRASQLEEAVNHPKHYGGKDNPYEAIKVIDAWGLGFCLGNTVKYISRAGKKDPIRIIEDLEKAAWYLQHEIERLKSQGTKSISETMNDLRSTASQRK